MISIKVFWIMWLLLLLLTVKFLNYIYDFLPDSINIIWFNLSGFIFLLHYFLYCLAWGIFFMLFYIYLNIVGKFRYDFPVISLKKGILYIFGFSILTFIIGYPVQFGGFFFIIAEYISIGLFMIILLITGVHMLVRSLRKSKLFLFCFTI